MSAKGASFSLFVGLELEDHGDNVYSFSGTPVDCVSFALSSYGKKFDLVVSGCNNGLNVSFDTMYSGTIGACLEAMTRKVPAIAFSCDGNFDLVDNNFDIVIDYIKKNNLLNSEYFISVNYPITGQIKGISLSKLFYRKNTAFYTQKDGKYYADRLDPIEECGEDTELFQIAHGYISLTPISKTYFSNSIYNELIKTLKN